MIGKSELAAALGWNRMRLDRTLKRDPKFPRDGNRFDLAKVRAYLDPPPPAIDTAQLRDIVKPPRPPVAEHRGEGTARQRKDAAQAELLEHKLQVVKEEMISRAEVTATVGNFLTMLGKSLDGLPDGVAKMLGLPESSVPIIREMVDDFRRELHANARPLLTDG